MNGARLLELGLECKAWQRALNFHRCRQCCSAPCAFRKPHGCTVGSHDASCVDKRRSHVLEKPMPTVVHVSRQYMKVIQCILAHKVTTGVSAYGSSSHTPISIWSSSELVKELHRTQGTATQKLCTLRGGSVAGRKPRLKSSHAYPQGLRHCCRSHLQEHI